MLSILSLSLILACEDKPTENLDTAPEVDTDMGTDIDTGTNPNSLRTGNIEVSEVARILL